MLERVDDEVLIFLGNQKHENEDGGTARGTSKRPSCTLL